VEHALGAGAPVSISNSPLNGTVSAIGGLALTICGSTAHGTVSVLDSVNGSLILNNSSGTGPDEETTRSEVEANTVGGSLSCVDSTPAPTNNGHPSKINGSAAGQCTGFWPRRRGRLRVGAPTRAPTPAPGHGASAQIGTCPHRAARHDGGPRTGVVQIGDRPP
jgi:hypothetical protein